MQLLTLLHLLVDSAIALQSMAADYIHSMQSHIKTGSNYYDSTQACPMPVYAFTYTEHAYSFVWLALVFLLIVCPDTQHMQRNSTGTR